MKGSGTTIMVRNMYENQGKNISEIARELKMSRNTVKKYLHEGPSQDKRIGTTRPSLLEPYKENIQELLDSGKYNSVVIFHPFVELE